MTTQRERILERVRKLSALVEERGATPEEAMAAAQKVRELLDRNGLDEADVAAAGLVVEIVNAGRTKRQEVDKLVGYVASASGCVAINLHGHEGLRFVYFGPDPTPLIARYLHVVCYRAVDAAVAEFRRSAEYRRRRKAHTRSAAARAFKSAMIGRLCTQLLQLGWLSQAEVDRLHRLYERRSGTRLVDGKSLKTKPGTARFRDASDAGRRAGSEVDLHRPIAGAGDTKLIGQ